MRRVAWGLAACAWAVSTGDGGAQGASGPAEAACLASPRSPGPEICRCAQEAAQGRLSPADQAEAARIIRDPDLYFAWRDDRRPAAQAFLERYLAWARAAEARCRR